MDQAFPPPPHHGRHGLLIPRRTTGDSASSTAGMPSSLRVRTATVCECPACTTARMRLDTCLVATDGPCATNSVLSQRTKKRENRIYCFVLNIICVSRGTTIHVVCGDLLFYCYFAFVLLCALHLLVCVCVPSVRGADTTDRSRRMYMRWSLACRSCLLLPLPSVCWCCGRAVCVCACCRGLECVSCVVCGVRCMPGCCPLLMCVCPLCVSAAPLVSPVALHVPHCADQLHTTERPHSQ
ncbi:mucin TcMUC [Trypanosoma cruzi]|uniref:Mucin TcMUC n=1 Tax=Trypanosoma cruzi TaxID=5693 RepID=A0A7J6XQV2_TRYCR|nr:mucin TcMUC [Trypanosoma cruzi]